MSGKGLMICLNFWFVYLIICVCGNYEKEDIICICMLENLVRENGYVYFGIFVCYGVLFVFMIS